MREKFEKFLRHVTAVVNAYYGEHFPKQTPTIEYEEGSVYWRIVSRDNPDYGTSRKVYGFVRKSDGAIFKAAGWKAPAVKSGVRGTLDNYPDELLGGHGIAYKNMRSYGPTTYPPRPE
jgi:hypothetical protein